MSFLKKYSLWIILIIAIGVWSYQYFVVNAVCTTPLVYNIGKFDNRFGMSTTTFLSAVEEASLIWENSLKKDLFTFGPRSKISINLVYDDRQLTTDKNRILNDQVEMTKENADSIKADFLALQNRYEKAKIEYEAMVESFKSRQAAYNNEVRSWNEKGGAPRSEFSRLNAEKNTLASLQEVAESKRLEVNYLADQINVSVKKYNFLVSTINSTIYTINQSAEKEFEEGEYIWDKNGRRINIYEFANRQVLVRVLAHEFGHALGLDHNENPDSIMHYLNTSKNMTPTEEDMVALKEACRVK